MSESNTALPIVRRLFEALRDHDLDTARGLLAPDVAYHLLNLVPSHQRTWHGIEDFLSLETSIDAATDHSYQSTIEALYPAGDELVIVHGSTAASIAGRSCSGLNWVMVARVVDGIVVQMVDTAETALDEFWRPRKTH